MDSQKQIGKKITALVLFIALVLPIAIPFIHIFDGHEHTTCSEKTTHIHKNIVKCDICSYNLTSFNYDIPENVEFFIPRFLNNTEANLASLQYHSFKTTNTRLRAPPIFS